MEKEKLVEVVRSYSRKISNPSNQYENMDFFCSKKEECKESEALEKSAELHEFCRSEVEFSVNAYKEENKPKVVEKEKPAFSKSSRGWESKTDHEEMVGEEKRFNDKENYGK